MHIHGLLLSADFFLLRKKSRAVCSEQTSFSKKRSSFLRADFFLFRKKSNVVEIQ
jgi:hypothetical protein